MCHIMKNVSTTTPSPPPPPPAPPSQPEITPRVPKAGVRRFVVGADGKPTATAAFDSPAAEVSAAAVLQWLR